MSYSWAKVYIEILDDHKMGMLPDGLWRRVIELILLAKKNDKDGWLPGMIEMSWILRIPAEQLEADLEKLAEVKIVEIKDGGWYLTNFAKRQSAEPVVERVRNFRTRAVQQSCNDSETQSYQTKTKTRLDTDKTSGATDAPAPRARDELFDAIASVCCIDPKVKGNGAKIGKARAALADSEPPYSASEVLAFGQWWNSDEWRRKKGPPTVWKLTEQVGIVRNGSGNGKATNANTQATPRDDADARECAARINARNGK